jgi:OOP family OmpA-OmpF porin
MQTAAPASGPAPGWYPPPPNWGGYAQAWQQPPHWAVPPQGYGQLPPRYPTHGQSQTVPAAPTIAENPLSAELKQTQEQLTASRTELDQARAMLEQLQGKLQHSLEAEQALIENVTSITSEQQALQARVTELNAELQTTREALQQAKSETTTSGRELTQAQTALTAAQSEVAATATLEVEAVEVAALQIANPDADEDGVPDSFDLCLETQQGVAVEPSGCAADVAISLEGVNFHYNSHELTDEAKRILDRVADTLSQHSDLRLQVAGHTDAQGDPVYNQWLSLQRAQAVRDYLVAQGVNPDHIGAAGYGGEQPIADNATKQGLRMNRRVELRNVQ